MCCVRTMMVDSKISNLSYGNDGNDSSSNSPFVLDRSLTVPMTCKHSEKLVNSQVVLLAAANQAESLRKCRVSSHDQ